MRGRPLVPIACLLALFALTEGARATVQPLETSVRARLARDSHKKKKRKHHNGKHRGTQAKQKSHDSAEEKTKPVVANDSAPTEETDEGNDSDDNFPMDGVNQSPLHKLGVPPEAVPVVATVAAVSVMALWPSVIKAAGRLWQSFLLIARQVLSGHLRVWAKRDKKLDPGEQSIELRGFRLRPRELLAICATAAVYGLAIAYTLLGFAVNPLLWFWQTLAALTILLLRSLVRFVYERRHGLVTVLRFWPAGGLLCLGSAYLGTTLATGCYELESAGRPDAAAHGTRLRVSVLLMTFALAIGFFAANWLHPHKVLQMGRLVASGMALSEVLPVTPMPGLRIYKWRRSVWAVLFGLVVPTYFLVNFIL